MICLVIAGIPFLTLSQNPASFPAARTVLFIVLALGFGVAFVLRTSSTSYWRHLLLLIGGAAILEATYALFGGYDRMLANLIDDPQASLFVVPIRTIFSLLTVGVIGISVDRYLAFLARKRRNERGLPSENPTFEG